MGARVRETSRGALRRLTGDLGFGAVGRFHLDVQGTGRRRPSIVSRKRGGDFLFLPLLYRARFGNRNIGRLRVRVLQRTHVFRLGRCLALK